MTGWICWKLSVKSKYLRMHPYFYLVYSNSLNVTRYSNTACALFLLLVFFCLSRLLYLSLSPYLSVFLILNRSQMVEWETILILLLLVNSTESLCMCAHMYVMFASIWWDLFLSHPFVILFFSLCAYLSLSLPLSISW
jgi:hypothetical protein